MTYRVEVYEIVSATSASATAIGVSEESITRYIQVVDVLDLPALLQVINRKPRAPRKTRTTKE